MSVYVISILPERNARHLEVYCKLKIVFLQLFSAYFLKYIVVSENNNRSWAWWHRPIIPVLL